MDEWYIGLISGIIVPLVTLLIFYFSRNTEDTFLIFLKVTFRYSILTKLISLAAIPDALLFFIFLWRDKIKSANGVIMALFLICIVVILIKFIS